MKVRTSVTLTQELIDAVEDAAGASSFSAFIEDATWQAIRRQRRQERDAHDAAIYAKYADEFNREALETLDYQIDIDELFESLEHVGAKDDLP